MTGWLIRHADAPRERAYFDVLVVMADAANDDGANIRLATRTVARRARMSTRYARSWLERARTDGWLEITAHGNRRRATVHRFPGYGLAKGDASAELCADPGRAHNSEHKDELCAAPGSAHNSGEVDSSYARDSAHLCADPGTAHSARQPYGKSRRTVLDVYTGLAPDPDSDLEAVRSGAEAPAGGPLPPTEARTRFDEMRAELGPKFTRRQPAAKQGEPASVAEGLDRLLAAFPGSALVDVGEPPEKESQ